MGRDRRPQQHAARAACDADIQQVERGQRTVHEHAACGCRGEAAGQQATPRPISAMPANRPTRTPAPASSAPNNSRPPARVHQRDQPGRGLRDRRQREHAFHAGPLDRHAALHRKNIPPPATAVPAARSSWRPHGRTVDGADADAQRVQAAGRDDEADAVEQRALPRRQLGAVRVAVEDRERADDQRRDHAAAAAARRRPPRRARSPTRRCRTRRRELARRASRAAPPRHHERKRHRQHPDRRCAELRAPQPDGDHREHVVEAGQRDAGNRSGSRQPRPAPTCANALARPASRARHAAEATACVRVGFHRSAAQQRRRTLQGPERAEATDDVAAAAAPPSAASASAARETMRCSASTRAMKPSCPISTPRLKVSSASGRSLRGRPALVRARREAEAVQQAEGERDDPGVADREAGLAAPRANDLRPQEEDGQRDREVQRQQRHAGEPSVAMASVRLCATVNAVTVFTSIQRSFDDQQQAQHEQQVIGAEQDVADAFDGVGAATCQPLCAAAISIQGCDGRTMLVHCAAVEQLRRARARR